MVWDRKVVNRGAWELHRYLLKRKEGQECSPMSLLQMGADSLVHLSFIVCPKPAFWYMGLLPCFPDSWRSHPAPSNSAYFSIPRAVRALTTGTAVGLVTLCTPSLCPGSHQLLRWGFSEVLGLSLLGVNGMSGQPLHRRSKTRQFLKKQLFS